MGERSLEPETERVRRIWERLAPRYDKDIRFFEKVLFAGGREWVCSHTRGEVLEIAVGTGRNLEYYPPDVRLTAIDLSASMLDIARQRADQLGRQVDLRVGDAQALEFADETFDTVVFTLSLCSIPDDRKAVAEARRALRAGGGVRPMEHGGRPVPGGRAGPRRPDWVSGRTGGGHPVRRPPVSVNAVGFGVGQ